MRARPQQRDLQHAEQQSGASTDARLSRGTPVLLTYATTPGLAAHKQQGCILLLRLSDLPHRSVRCGKTLEERHTQRDLRDEDEGAAERQGVIHGESRMRLQPAREGPLGRRSQAAQQRSIQRPQRSRHCQQQRCRSLRIIRPRHPCAGVWCREGTNSSLMTSRVPNQAAHGLALEMVGVMEEGQDVGAPAGRPRRGQQLQGRRPL